MQTPIAVVGQACVLPGVLSPASLWEQVLANADLTGASLTGSRPARTEQPLNLALGGVANQGHRKERAKDRARKGRWGRRDCERAGRLDQIEGMLAALEWQPAEVSNRPWALIHEPATGSRPGKDMLMPPPEPAHP